MAYPDHSHRTIYNIRFSLILLFALQLSNTFSQDTLYFNDGSVINGEIKEMKQNLLKIDAEYGDEDFIIEWDEIKRIYTSTYLFIYLTDGSVQYGWLRSESDSTVDIISSGGMINTYENTEIIKLFELNQGFRNRFDAAFDIGLAIAKANNLRRLTTSGNLGYRAEKWLGKTDISTHNSIQDQAEPIRRYEGNILFRYLFYRDWALNPSMNFLSNTEQSLALRTSMNLSIGKYIVRNMNGHWGLEAGVNRNMERFSNDAPNRNSWEGSFGSELDIYGIKDLDIYTTLTAFPSITEQGRWRADFNFIIKYDLPLDFYIKTEFSLNYDNQPATEGSEVDYVLQLGFGWDW